jgi:hypothetical protein
LPKRIGLPCSRWSWVSAATSFAVKCSNAPSLKTGQFWNASTNPVPTYWWARLSTVGKALASVSIGARDEAPAAAERERSRDERGLSTEPIGVDGRTLAEQRGRRVLALGEPVDPVVEQDHLEVHVAAEQVHQVVAADAEAVAVAGDHPDVELGVGQLHAGRDRGARPWIVWKP